MTNTDTQTAATEGPAKETPAEAMRDKYDDKGKIIVTSQDQFAAFEELLGTFNETDPLQDWTKKAPDDGSFNGFALVRTEDEKNRLIALPSKEAFLANVNATTWAFTRFVRHILNIASSVDAGENQFVIVDGCIKAKYDLTGFKSQAMKVVKWLRGQGLQGITVPGLRQALASSAFATSQFPRAKAENWTGLLSRMIALAEQQGHDTSLFQFWVATRDAKKDEGEEVTFDLGDFSLEDDESEDAAE